MTNRPGYDFAPAWSPDGARIAFASDRDGDDEIFTMSANGAAPTQVTSNRAWDSSPDWQPLRAVPAAAVTAPVPGPAPVPVSPPPAVSPDAVARRVGMPTPQGGCVVESWPSRLPARLPQVP